MKNIIFVAAPAAGKGTISAKVCTEYNIPHISTGDLLRNEIAASSKIGMEIKSAMARGEFVSDEVITKLLKKRLEAKDCKKGFILDGYPRNISQAKTYDNILKEFDKIIGLKYLQCVHVNDSKNLINTHKDRHENIGFGTIGFNNLIKIIYHDKLKDIPKILETPYINIDNNSKERMYPPYKFEIAMILNKKFDENLISKIREYYK